MFIDKEKLVELIILWIFKNYGGQEAEDPCYNIEKLADYIIKNIEKISEEVI